MKETDFEAYCREQTRKDLLNCLFNIIKDENGNFRIEHNYYLDENGKLAWHYDFDEWYDKKNCFGCRFCYIHGHHVHCTKAWELFGYNRICNIVRCDAEDIVEPLTLIKSQAEMIEYFDRIFNYFGYVDDWARYCGIDVSQYYDDETGEELEVPTAKKHFENGGTIKKLPDKYPVVVWYDINCERPLEMLYVGTETL